MLPSLHRVVVFFAVGVALTLAGCGEKNQRCQNRACATSAGAFRQSRRQSR
jgi:hypothetical protein